MDAQLIGPRICSVDSDTYIYIVRTLNEAGFSRATHADHGMGFSRHIWQTHVPPGGGGRGRVQGVGEFLADDVSHGVLGGRTA